MGRCRTWAKRWGGSLRRSTPRGAAASSTPTCSAPATRHRSRQSSTASASRCSGPGPRRGCSTVPRPGACSGSGSRNGSEVVIKAYQQRWQAPFLRAVHKVQAHVGGRGLPCASPLRGPTPLVPGPRTRPSSNRCCRTPASGRSRRRRSAGCRRPDWPGRSPPAASCRRCPAGRPSTAAALRRPLRSAAQPLVRLRRDGGGGRVDRPAARRALADRDADERPPVVAHTDWSARTCVSMETGCSPSTTGTAWRWYRRVRRSARRQ